MEIAQTELYQIARTVGSVFQNPRSQFFCVDTTGELAFGCENLGIPPNEIIQRIAAAAWETNAKSLLGRSIFQLSGGEKQKIACASVSAMEPDVFVLDEPTSNLDIQAIENLRETLLRWKSRGKTIVIAEHRLYWLTELCDRVVYLQDGQIELDLSMRDFRRFSQKHLQQLGLRTLEPEKFTGRQVSPQPCDTFTVQNYRYAYKHSPQPVLDIPLAALPKGGIIAVIGHNGAGKSTFSKCLCGLQKRFKGTCRCKKNVFSRRRMLKQSYLVMQDVNHQLFCESVEEELRLSQTQEDEAVLLQTMTALELLPFKDRHPMSLSGGQKQRVAIACALLAQKEFLIFDEPTSGLDFHHMEQTAALLCSLKGKQTLFLITHDPEFILRCCDFVLHMEHGKITEQYPLDQTGYSKLQQFFYMKERTESFIEYTKAKTTQPVFLSVDMGNAVQRTICGFHSHSRVGGTIIPCSVLLHQPDRHPAD